MSDRPRLSDLGELELIRRIRALGLVRPEGVVRGIGDDAAVFRLAPPGVAVVSTDLLVEGVHFLLGRSDPRALGARALAVNLSDLAAMGARPRECFLGLAAPGALAFEDLEYLLEGFAELAREHQVNLLGGDCSSSPGPLVLSVTVVGEGDPCGLLYRDGAREGDVVAVTGALGDSAGGLALLDRGLAGSSAGRRTLLAAHHSPRPHLAEGQWLAACGAATAMIDLSDGLLSDLGHVLEESGRLGAVIEGAELPISAPLRELAAELGFDPTSFALQGGEDYALLVTLDGARAERTTADFVARFGRPLYRIGQVDAGPGVRLRPLPDGAPEAVSGAGFQHWQG